MKTLSFCTNPDFRIEEIVKEHQKAAANLGHKLSEGYEIGLRNGWREAMKFHSEGIKNGNVIIRNNVIK
jgi:flagellar biosynthesis/type III secretory pathway protein FliH